MGDDTADRRRFSRRSDDAGLYKLHQEVGELKAGQRAMMRSMENYMKAADDARGKMRRSLHTTNNELQLLTSEKRLREKRRVKRIAIIKGVAGYVAAGAAAIVTALIAGLGTGLGDRLADLFTRHGPPPPGGD